VERKTGDSESEAEEEMAFASQLADAERTLAGVNAELAGVANAELAVEKLKKSELEIRNCELEIKNCGLKKAELESTGVLLKEHAGSTKGGYDRYNEVLEDSMQLWLDGPRHEGQEPSSGFSDLAPSILHCNWF
jgi:hypothetical protein